MVVLELPYPPSVNHSHVMAGGRYFPSKKTLEFRKHVSEICLRQAEAIRAEEFQNCKLDVLIYLFPPDTRKRDIDNPIKGLFDSLTFAGVWEDDKQVDRMVVEKKQKFKGGRVIIAISKLEREDAE